MLPSSKQPASAMRQAGSADRPKVSPVDIWCQGHSDRQLDGDECLAAEKRQGYMRPVAEDEVLYVRRLLVGIIICIIKGHSHSTDG
jgi:hypothetical protein